MSTSTVSLLLVGMTTLCTSAEAFAQSSRVATPVAAPLTAAQPPTPTASTAQTSAQASVTTPSAPPSNAAEEATNKTSHKGWFSRFRQKDPRFSSRGLGIFWSPESTFSDAEGIAFSGQRYGNHGRTYASRLRQVKLGNGFGAQAEGYRVTNLLELEGFVSPILGGNLLEFAGDVHTKSNSRNYYSWTMHADAGLRIGEKNSCFAALTGGFGLNSGSRTDAKGGWFRRETSALLSTVCGRFALGFSLRSVRDADGTIGHATGSARIYVDENESWGLGTALSVTGYSDRPRSQHLGRQPWLAFEADNRQTMIRFTVEFKLDGKKDPVEKKKESTDEDEDNDEHAMAAFLEALPRL